MKPNASSTVALWLRVLAWAQGAAIAGLAWLLCSGEVPQPLPAAAVPIAKAEGPPERVEPALSLSTPSPPTAAAVPATAPAPQRQAAQPEGTVLYGQVLDAAGAPVRDAIVWFTRDGASQPFATVNATAFAIGGAMPGAIDIRTRATGFRELRDTIEIPAGTPRLRHDIVLQSAWNLAVKILTPEGRPLHAVLEELHKERPALYWINVGALATSWQPDGDFPPTDLREADYGVGRWRAATGIGASFGDGPKIGKEFAGVLELDQRQPLWISAVLRHLVLASAAVEPGQAEVTLTVSLDQAVTRLGSVRLRVVDGATGAPVPEAHVSINDGQSSGGGAQVDAQGQIEIRDLRPGRLRVGISATKDRSGPAAEILLAPGQRLDLGDVPLLSRRTIKGRCENLDGKGDRLSLQATSLEAPANVALQRATDRAQVAEDGTFTLWLVEGRYLLRASGAGGGLFELDTRTQGTEPLVLRLVKEAEIRLDVRTNDLLELAVVAPNGRPVFKRWLKDGWKFPIRCLPGDYRVELKDRHGAVSVRQLHVGPEGADLRVP